MRSVTVTLILVLTFVLSALPASAEVIYDNGVPESGAAFSSDLDPNPDWGMSIESADDFVLGGPVTLADVHWWGIYGLVDPSIPEIDNFAIRLFEDAGGQPAAAPFYEAVALTGNRQATGNLGPLVVYEYTADITPVVLAGGTAYWISIVNNTAGIASTWRWLASTEPGNMHMRADGGTWDGNHPEFELAFQLTGSREVIPEPASVALLALGLTVMLVRSRAHTQ